jgi:serine/threonine protein kinase
MSDPTSPDLLDRLVAEYSDALAGGGEPDQAALLERVPPDQRETLERCLRMVRAGLLPAPAATDALVPGVELDGFRIVRELGRGGMAVVYLAEQLDLRRHVALKVLRPSLAIERRHVERFQREALTAARLKHPHIVPVHAVGETRGYHWLAMEHVEGPTLAEVLERLQSSGKATRQWTARDLHEAAGLEPMRGAEASYEQALCALLAPAARALGAAHELGLVHRDVKPSNILIHRDGRALIADFGLAKGESDPGLSLTGEPLGTPFYMSPEQATLTTLPVDQRSDVYSFGVTLYEALAGRRPFEGATVFAVLEAIQSRAPAPLRAVAPRTSAAAQAVVRRAMAFDPAERYPSALDLAAELTALAEGRATQALAQEGGPLQRLWRMLRQGRAGQLAEYRSARTFLGLPLVHIHFGRRARGQARRVARGWFAAGDVAVGGIACGGVALGGISFGGIALGLLTCWAGIAFGAYPMGGVSVGAVPVGGVAAGYASFGGVAAGRYAIGGLTLAPHAAGGDGRKDEQALRWFRDHGSPWMSLMLPGVSRWMDPDEAPEPARRTPVPGAR